MGSHDQRDATMVEVLCRERKSPVLTPSSIPCLRRLPTINVSEGCLLGCTYCYIQGYTNYPGPDRIRVYVNTPERVQTELQRKRRPRRVFFCPSSDAFQPAPEVQDVSYHTMSLLLNAGIEVAFLTKGDIPQRFLNLFATHRKKVFAQIGITTLDVELQRAFEPKAASPEQRIAGLQQLLRAGIAVSVRLDPLIPDLTDAPSQLMLLLERLSRVGITRAAASYLFLRRQFAERMVRQLSCAGSVGIDTGRWHYQRFVDGCSGGRMLNVQERAERFARVAAAGARHGIRIVSCRCKNPELGGPGCAIAGPATVPPSLTEQTLFPFALGDVLQ